METIAELANIIAVENFKSIKLVINYTVKEGYSGRLVYYDGAGQFDDLDATAGEHSATLTYGFAVKAVKLHVPAGNAGGSVYVKSIDYVVTYLVDPNAVEEPTLGEKTNKGTMAITDLNDFSKATVVDTPEAAVGQKGFGEKALKVSGTSANVTYELTQKFNALTKIEGFVKVTFTVYYYVESVEGTGTFRLRCDSQFPHLDSTVGYHVTEITPVDGNGTPVSVDYLCIYFDTAVYGTLYIGSIDYVITYMGEAE